METIKIAEEMKVKKVVLTCLKRKSCGRIRDQGFADMRSSVWYSVDRQRRWLEILQKAWVSTTS